MIDLGTIAGLHSRAHELHAYCLRCDRWRVLDLATLVARGLGVSTLIQHWPTDTTIEGLPLISVPISDPVDDIELVIAYAANVAPTHRARTFLRYAKEMLARPDWPRTTD